MPYYLLHLSNEGIHELNLLTVNTLMDISSHKYDYTS